MIFGISPSVKSIVASHWTTASSVKSISGVTLTVCYYYHVTYEFQSESTLYILPECQGIPCLIQLPYLKFMWQQRDSNPQRVSSYSNTQPFRQTKECGFTLKLARNIIIT